MLTRSNEPMKKTEIVIIGAGASGLMAGCQLTEAGYKVTILEARNRAGGRIHTLTNHSFSYPVEGGAEFVHGRLPVTFNLLEKAGIEAIQADGDSWQWRDGRLRKGMGFMEHWDLVIQKLKELKHDLSIGDFLNTYFSEEKYASLRSFVSSFAEGYDAADISKASSFALREEWLAEDTAEQFRIKGGYQQLISYLQKVFEANGGVLQLNAVVKRIAWRQGRAEVSVAEERTITADKVVLSVPMGVLQLPSNDPAAIVFSPAIPDKIAAARKIGFGGVVKVLIEFREAFWESRLPSESDKSRSDALFLFSDAFIPTWWTQFPDRFPLLTGWLAGPKTEQVKDKSEQEIFHIALDSLSLIFGIPVDTLQQWVVTSKVINWVNDPFSRGAYAYATLETGEARKELCQPVADTLYFTGEALYDGAEMGMVEAALSSGALCAERIQKAARVGA